jgi:hypothetical protein
MALVPSAGGKCSGLNGRVELDGQGVGEEIQAFDLDLSPGSKIWGWGQGQSFHHSSCSQLGGRCMLPTSKVFGRRRVASSVLRHGVETSIQAKGTWRLQAS